MNTATLSPPPRPPRNGNIARMAGPDDGGNSGYRANLRRWFRGLLKAAVLLLFALVAGQLTLILFRTISLWFFR
jgi:hypothetical protein